MFRQKRAVKRISKHKVQVGSVVLSNEQFVGRMGGLGYNTSNTATRITSLLLIGQRWYVPLSSSEYLHILYGSH